MARAEINGMGRTTIGRGGLQWLWAVTLLAAVTGIGAIFLPYTFDTSPADVMLAYLDEGEDLQVFWPIASPFLLAILISAVSLRELIGIRPLRFERMTAHLLSVALAGGTLYFLGPFFADNAPDDVLEWLMLLLPLAILATGARMVIKNWRAGASHALSSVLSMQVVYLANAAFCLFGFFPDWQSGAYATLLTALLYLAQLAIAYRRMYRSHVVQGA